MRVVLLALWVAGSVGCRPEAPPVGPTPTSTTPSPPTTPTTPTTPTLPPAWPPGATVLPGVTVWDADGARGPVTVVLDGATVHAVWDGEPAPPADAVVLPVRGAWVVPGLIDPHVHLFLSGAPWWVGDTLAGALRATVAHGVTTAVDVGGPPASYALRDRIAAGEVLGPELLALGPMVTAPGSHPCESAWDPSFCTPVVGAAAGAAAAAERVTAGSDGAKVAIADASFTPWPTPRLDPDALQALVDGTPGLLVAHVDEEDDALLALDAGVSTLGHPVFGGAPSPEALARIAREATATHSTLGAFSGTLELLDGTLPIEVRGADPRVGDAWSWVAGHPASVDPEWIAGSAAWTARAEATVLALDAAGATVLPASDAGYLYVPHGLGLHLELQRLADLGFEPERLLVAATADAAAALGLSDRGRIAPGQRADLLVLGGDPRDDLASLVAPDPVILAGTPWSAAALEQVDPLRVPAPGALGQACVDDRDCGAWACDRVVHACVEPCDRVADPRADCGTDAWCAPAELTFGEPVCREVRTCDPYAPAPCADGWDERCAPLDHDTFGCLAAGPRAEGEACDPVDPSGTCGAGLHCALPERTCRRLCDPSAPGDPCGVGGTCRAVLLDGATWFGLCG